MLATSKMTGLDLGGRDNLGGHHIKDGDPDSSKRSSTSSDEMLSTPKLLPDSAGAGSGHNGHFSRAAAASFMMQSRQAVALASLASSTGSISPRQPYSEHNSTNNNIQMHHSPNDGDMLTTPVVTTPKTSDLWMTHPAHTPPHLKSNSGMSPGPGSSLPLEPPSNLPMDSDINLRSPCEGIVAKRRKFQRKQQSSFSDSNSCDTPTSENSPRDLTIPKAHGGCGLEFRPHSVEPSSNPSTPTLVKRSPTPPIATATATEPRASLPPSFKQPHKPQPLHLKDVSDLSASLSAHFSPNPLTLPSPNWERVNRYFEGSGSLLKTPKHLDGQLTFAFDGVTPLTPRSAKHFHETTGLDPERYSRPGLSPRDPPRLNIPEIPEDLSPSCRKPQSMHDRHASQNSEPSSHHQQLQQKMEEDRENSPRDLTIPKLGHGGNAGLDQFRPHSVEPTIKQEITPRSPPPLQQIMHPEIPIKIEGPPHVTQLPGPIVTGPGSFDLRMAAAMGYGPNGHTSNHPLPLSHEGVYRRYLHQHQAREPSPPSVVSTISAPTGYREHHNSSPNYPPPPAHGGPNWPHQPWPSNPPMLDEEPSVSPPHYTTHSPPNVKPPKSTDTLMSTLTEPFKQAKLEVTPSPSKKPRSSGPKAPKSKTGSGTGAGSGSTGKAGPQPELDEGGNRRVYSCPHCQRSYDWNYNLNRHLKYECGKENAFQCAKCGRKFPHKQNCVYHLKRKHKIVCETIDQYMANGLVIFRGSANAGGQHIANPQLGQNQ